MDRFPMPETPQDAQRLREALDDLWSCIAKSEIAHLEPETVELAKANHDLLWHGDERIPFYHDG